MGRSKPKTTVSPIMPTENVGMVSGPIRGSGKRSGGGRSVASQVTMMDPKTGQMYGGLVIDGVAKFKAPDGSTPQFKFPSKGPDVSIPIPPPSSGESPEREVPIPMERDTSPRGRAPFSPNERGMARDRFFERMFERSEERRQQRSMEREERDNVRDSLRSERGLRASEEASPGDERQGRRGEGGMRRRRGRRIADPVGQENRRGNRNRRGRRMRRRDFTRRRSQMEGGRRGRSGREMAEFRDRYISTLR